MPRAAIGVTWSAEGAPGIEVLDREPSRVAELWVQLQWPSQVAVRDDGQVRVRWCVAPRSIDEVARDSLAGRAPLGAHLDVTGAFPTELGRFDRLATLSVDDRVEGTLPDAIGRLTPLRELRLQGWDGLTALPGALAALRQLVVLRLPPSLRHLPGGLPFPQLRQLEIPFELLEAHRAQLPALTALEELELVPTEPGDDPWDRHGAALPRFELPEEVTALPALRSLRAKRLGLERLPANLPRLTHLTHLDLWCCRMAHLTELATAMPGLRAIDATGNRLSAAEERWLPKLLKLPAAERTSAVPPAKVPPKVPPARGPERVGQRLSIPSWDAVWSFDGSASGGPLVAGERGGHRVCAWDAETGALSWETTLVPGHTVDDRVCVAFDREGRVVASTATLPGRVFWLDAETGAVLRDQEVPVGFHSFVLAERAGPDGLLLADTLASGTRGALGGAVFRYPDLAPLAALPGYVGVVSPRGDAVTGGSTSGQLVRIDLPSLRVRWAIAADTQGHAFTPDGARLVVLGRDLKATVYDAETGDPLAQFCWAPECVALPSARRPTGGWPAFDPTGTLLAVLRAPNASHHDATAGTIGIVDVATRTQRFVLPAHEPPPGRLDPKFGAGELSALRSDPSPAMRWWGGRLVVGAWVRADDEPRVGAGLTSYPIDALLERSAT
ncbi:MAG: hypothetical protein ABMB14_09525 [Myxococcota bacterium]